VSFPVYGIALIGLFIGFVLGGIVSWIQNGQTRRRIRDLQKQSEADQREIATLRDRLARLEETERQATIPPAPAPSAELVARG
jgi:transcription elongation GreA/GreB family factor